MVKTVDRILEKGKSRAMFFVVTGVKMMVIAGGFYLAARGTKAAVTSYMLGLSVIVASIMVEGVYQLYRSYSHD